MTQPKIEGVGHGVPRTLFASDGSNWYALKVRDSGILEVCSKSGDKIFGFESIVEEALENLTLSAGTNTLDGTAVPAGKIWNIIQFAIEYIGTVPSKVLVRAVGLAGNLVLFNQLSPASTIWYPYAPNIYLQAGDYMQGIVDGATLNDDLYFRYTGVQMNAP